MSRIKNAKAFISILVGVGAFALIPVVRWALYEIDHQFANIGTAVCLFIGLTSLAIAFLRRATPRLRAGGAVSGVVLLVTAIACFEFRGMTGELVPTFRWRFSRPPAASLFSNTPSHRTGKSELADEALAASFQQYLGNTRTGVVDSPALNLNWETTPPKQMWRVPVGAGWSGICVAEGKVWTLFQDEDREAIVCLELISGRELYRRSFPGMHYEPLGGKGPRSTPTWFDGKVVFQTATGQVICLNADSGEVIWEQDLLHLGFDSQSASEKVIKWGRSGSPLVVSVEDQQLVILPLGGDSERGDDVAPTAGNEPARTLVALELNSGRQVWRGGQHQIAYASPSLFSLDGVPQVVSVNEGFVSGHSLATGAQLWQTDWPNHSNADACASQAVLIGKDQVLISKGYASGAKLIRVRQSQDESIATDPGQWHVEQVWKSHRVLKTKLTSAVHVAGRLYGLSDGILECVDALTGERIWRKGRYGQGQCLVVNNHLLVTSEMGKLVLVRMEDGEALFQQSVLDGVCWNYPAVAGPFVLMRNGSEMVCFYSGDRWPDETVTESNFEEREQYPEQVEK